MIHSYSALQAGVAVVAAGFSLRCQRRLKPAATATCNALYTWTRRHVTVLGVVALLLGSVAPAAAETLTFRNQSGAAVVVQAASVYRGVFRRDRPHLLQSGETTDPGITLMGDKVITIYDATVPNRVLFQGTLPGQALNRSFRILPGSSPARVRVRAERMSGP